MVKFDSAGVLVSRDIGLQPSPSRPFIVYSFCLGVVTSQDIHFRGSLPPTDCVSLWKKLKLNSFFTFLAILMHNLTDSIAFFGRYDDSTIPMWANYGWCISIYQKQGPRMGSGGSFRNWFVSLLIFFDLSICLGNRWQNLMAIGVFAWQISQSDSFNIYPFVRLCLLSYPLSPHPFVTTESPYTNLILDIFVIHLNMLRQRFIQYIPILEEILGISHREID